MGCSHSSMVRVIQSISDQLLTFVTFVPGRCIVGLVIPVMHQAWDSESAVYPSTAHFGNHAGSLPSSAAEPGKCVCQHWTLVGSLRRSPLRSLHHLLGAWCSVLRSGLQHPTHTPSCNQGVCSRRPNYDMPGAKEVFSLPLGLP